jgi:hypothetical protein
MEAQGKQNHQASKNLESTDSNFANHLTEFELLRSAQNGIAALMIDNEKLDMVLDAKLANIVLT